jgi:hypothetical protein
MIFEKILYTFITYLLLRVPCLPFPISTGDLGIKSHYNILLFHPKYCSEIHRTEMGWQKLKTLKIAGYVFTNRASYVLTILTDFGRFRLLMTTFTSAACR